MSRGYTNTDDDLGVVVKNDSIENIGRELAGVVRINGDEKVMPVPAFPPHKQTNGDNLSEREKMDFPPSPIGMDIGTMYKHHFLIWDKIAELNIQDFSAKAMIPKTLGFGYYPHGCSACNYAGVPFSNPGEPIQILCHKHCPLEWGTYESKKDAPPCEIEGSPYAAWKQNMTPENAIKVRSVPLRANPEKEKPEKITLYLEYLRKNKNKDFPRIRVMMKTEKISPVVIANFYDDGRVFLVKNGYPHHGHLRYSLHGDIRNYFEQTEYPIEFCFGKNVESNKEIT